MTVTIRRNVTVRLPRLELIGDVELSQHEGGRVALLLLTEEGAEVLSLHHDAPPPLQPDEVLIKDYSEHVGLASALQDVGIVKVTGHFNIGPFKCRVCIAKIQRPSQLFRSLLSPEFT